MEAGGADARADDWGLWARSKVASRVWEMMKRERKKKDAGNFIQKTRGYFISVTTKS